MSDRIRKDVTEMMAIFTLLPEILMKGLYLESEYKINHTQKKTLMFMYQHEGMPMNYYSKLTNLESGSFTYAAKGLVKNGLIRRVESSDDHRKTGLVLTAKGRQVAEMLYKEMETHVNRLLDVLTEEDRRRFYGAIRVLYDTKAKFEAGLQNEG